MTRGVARLAIVPVLAFTTWQFLAPPSSDPGLPVDDTVLHALVFAVLTGLVLAAGVPVRVTLACLAVYAVGIEIAQGLMPYGRTPEALDVVADLVGVAGVLAAKGLIARRRRAAVSR